MGNCSSGTNTREILGSGGIEKFWSRRKVEDEDVWTGAAWIAREGVGLCGHALLVEFCCYESCLRAIKHPQVVSPLIDNISVQPWVAVAQLA